ncbi:Ankyrin repeats (3 copies) [Legionella nautarum]|uniref:Ankyrin repeats (3 copies) n=1 Tax=Legionella nautarum TaxID=45070 RepID=A0A0W0WN87_9GAMM|nr:ankyrin repeat domain-containing protein [Legionella nautarum]KTD33793.1 Ankyrin repeats (3 copies) [Legionella nautarum]
MGYYCTDPKFRSLEFLHFPDEELLSFIRRNFFNPNALWAKDNPFLHLILANEFYSSFERLIDLIPERINPNLCDGEAFGRKSLLILLCLLPPSDSVALKFIELYKHRLDLNYQDKTGKTALHYAIILGRYKLASCLVELGASLDIIDENGYIPEEYVQCPVAVVASTLKSIDIDPARDINASRNKLSDHFNRPLQLQGIQLPQVKSMIQHVFADKDLVLVKYIEGQEGICNTFVGDNCVETYRNMQKFAVEIASNYNISLKKIFVCEPLKEDELFKFKEVLVNLNQTLSGISIYEQCVEGHKKLQKLFEMIASERSLYSNNN